MYGGSDWIQSNRKGYGVKWSCIKFFNDKRLYAIGECGLDYHYGIDNKEEQKQLFILQCNLAIELNLPIIVHSRDADLDTYNIIKLNASSFEKDKYYIKKYKNEYVLATIFDSEEVYYIKNENETYSEITDIDEESFK